MRLNPFHNEDKEREQRQHRHELLTAHVANRAAQQQMTQQLKDSMGQAYFLQEDEHTIRIIEAACPDLIPTFSRMNATSKIEKPRDRRLMELRLDDILLHKEMEIGDEDGMINIVGLGLVNMRTLYKSLRMFGGFRIFDALGGYRGMMVTQDIQKTTHVIEEPKKKGIL